MIKETINRIDRELKSMFDSVSITEGAVRGEHHFDLTLEKVVDGRRARVSARVPKHAIASPLVPWTYLSDPRDPMGHVVEMVSENARLAEDMLEVATKRRLDRSYLESLQAVGQAPAEPEPEDLRSDLVVLIERMGMVATDTRTATEDGLMVEVSTFKGDVRPSDRVRIDMALSGIDCVSHMWVGERLVVKQLI